MVQYIPGPETLLAPAAQQITEGVLNFINPHRQFQQAVQAALAQNPEVAQHFANLEASSPGLLRSLGIGKLASVPATPEKQFELRNREAIIAGKEAQLGAQTAQSIFTSDQIQRALAMFQQDPSIGFDAALKMTTGETSSERAVSKLKGQQAEAGTAAMQIPGIYAAAGQRAATGQTPGEAAKDQFTSDTINLAQELLANGPEVTIQNFLDNKYNNKQLLAIFGTPLGEALNQQLDFLNNQYRIGIMAGRGDDAMERLKLAQAFSLLTRLQNPNIGMTDVQRFLEDPDAAIAARDTANIAPGDSGLAAIGQELGRMNTGTRSKILTDLDRDLVAQVTALGASSKNKDTAGENGDAARGLIVSAIDKILAQKAAISGGPRYRATFEEVPRGPLDRPGKDFLPRINRKEMVIRGPDGKQVSIDVASQASTIPTVNKQIPDSLATLMKRTYDAAKTPGEKQALYSRWIAEEPENATEIQQILGIKPPLTPKK